MERPKRWKVMANESGPTHGQFAVIDELNEGRVVAWYGSQQGATEMVGLLNNYHEIACNAADQTSEEAVKRFVEQVEARLRVRNRNGATVSEVDFIAGVATAALAILGDDFMADVPPRWFIFGVTGRPLLEDAPPPKTPEQRLITDVIAVVNDHVSVGTMHDRLVQLLVSFGADIYDRAECWECGRMDRPTYRVTDRQGRTAWMCAPCRDGWNIPAEPQPVAEDAPPRTEHDVGPGPMWTPGEDL